MSLNPADLLLFIRVVEEGSFTLAAERLKVPKSTLSRRIAILEEMLGEILLRRTTRRLTITDFGHTFYLQAKRVAHEIDIAAALSERPLHQPGGLLRLSMPGDFTHDMLGPFLSRFIARYPDIQLEINVSQRRVDLTAENYDLALRLGSVASDATLVVRRITTFQPQLFASPAWLEKNGEPRTPDDLLAHRVLALQMSGVDLPVWEMEKEGMRWANPLPTLVKANSPGILKEMALAGAGIVCLAGHYVRPHTARGELKALLTDWQLPGIPVWAVFSGRRLIPARTRIFIEELKQHLNGKN